MITDSPYDAGELVMRPRNGIIVGMGASVMMLAMLAALVPLSGISHLDALNAFAGILVSTSSGSLHILYGLGLHLAVGAVLGVLYCACQQRIPVRGLVFVGVFYGFVIWVAGGLIVSPIIGGEIREVLRSWSWLLASLIYGLSLTTAAVWSENRRSTESTKAVAVD